MKVYIIKMHYVYLGFIKEHTCIIMIILTELINDEGSKLLIIIIFILQRLVIKQ